MTNKRHSSDTDTMTNQKLDATTKSESPSTVTERIDTHPTLRPTAVWLGIVVMSGLSAVLYLMRARSSFSNPEAIDIFVQAVITLTLLVSFRFLIRMYIFKRTRYVVDAESVTRKYDLFFKSRRNEVPLSMVRSSELTQSRLQKLLGCGTIKLNEGLGSLELENVPDPHELNDTISARTRESGK